MTVLLVTALHAAETLVAFHRERAENSLGAAREYHLHMAQRCGDDAELSRRAILAAGATVENQVNAVRSRDMATAQKIIDGHR